MKTKKGVLLLLSVVILANNQDKKFINALQNILNRSFRTINCIGRCLDARCENAELLLTDGNSFDLIYSEATLVLFKDAAPLSVGFESSRQILAVADSCNKEALRSASETNFPAITCGLTPRDTITLSSFNEDSAVINLQRSVTCFDGTIIEPQEIPIRLCSTIDSFALMCVATIFILSGNIGRLSQFDI